MGAKGNTYWKLAKGFAQGAPRKYTPETLWEKAVEYFRWVEDNPLYEEKLFGSGFSGTISKMRAMTINGFCLFAQMDTSTFSDYEKQKAYSGIIARIRSIIYDQKFTGAAAGLFETNIIARELGLADKQEVKQESTITTVTFTHEDEGL